MSFQQLSIVVLAAGNGRRMKSRQQKVMVPLWGKPLLGWVLDSAFDLAPERVLVVIGHGADEVRAYVDACYGERVSFVVQEERRGTGHAVQQCRPRLGDVEGNVLVLCGDVPLIRPQTLALFLHFHRQGSFKASLLSGLVDEPQGYGRVIRDAGGKVARIVEDREAGPSERVVREINSGVTLFDRKALFAALEEIEPANAQEELYLTDVFHTLKAKKQPIGAFVHDQAEELFGVNSRAQLNDMGAMLVRRWREQGEELDLANILRRISV
ncbi:MAG: NTP transferase domain-containing protein [Candidatus Omnitrophica bacterium]|nr:NTP transferase domain-containing protein [Candidatus Omnitrophota bacterium]